MRNLLTYILGLACCAIALAEPTTKPKDIAPKDAPKLMYVALIADMTRPAYVPAFATPTRNVALQDHRDHALMFDPPAPFFAVYGPYAPYGLWGSYGRHGYVANHGFYR